MNFSSRHIQQLIIFLTGIILGVILVSLGFALGRDRERGTFPPNSLNVYSSENDDAIVQAVKVVGAAVVNVNASMAQGAASSALPGLPPAPHEGKGTGVIFDAAKGLMLTNAHVVTDPQSNQQTDHISVRTRDGREFTGKVLGADQYSDIAVVKLAAKNLTAAKIAQFNSVKQLAIGQWAIAIGNPYGQENTVTVGVISAVNRTIPVPEQGGATQFYLTGMIQTDAAINPGNSGGALCNLKGEVIGINTAIIPWATGLGFAIPIDRAMDVARQIIDQKQIHHPYIGVAVVDITEDIRQKYPLKSTFGAQINEVQENSPAARAGLQMGDIITQFGHQRINGVADLLDGIARTKVGDAVNVQLARKNKILSCTIKVGDRPDRLKSSSS